jgi:uncharacterized protein (DUF885 family)
MRLRLASLVALPILFACGSPAAPPASPSSAGGGAGNGSASSPGALSPHARFGAFASRVLAGYLDHYPTDATILGDHAHDDRFPDVTVEGDAETRKWVASMRAELATFAPADLDADDRTDASIVKNRLDEIDLWDVEVKDHERNPLYYVHLISDGLDPLVTREFAPLEVRTKSLRARLLGVPAVVASAKKRLQHPSRVSTETAIDQTKGLLGLCEEELPAIFAKVPAQKADLEAANKVAIAALKDLSTFFSTDLLARSDGSFRAGKDLFTKIVHHSFDDDLDVDALAKDARATMADTRERMVATAIELWPQLMKGPTPQPKTDAEKRAAIKAVLDKLAEDHPTDATIVADAKKVLAEQTAFVREHDLARLPDEPCDVIEMPVYKRGVTVAYCDSSGPLEAKPQTFVAISPPPADWPEARRLSHYREYNQSMLRELIVHEAMPGHYLQLMHGNRVKSPIRVAFQDGSFIEGWAVYSEWLMAKHGYGGAKVRMEQLKMLLRVAGNAVLDHAVHAEQIEEKDAVAMLESEAFQEEGEAVGKWKRARLSKGQLSTYYYGFRELMKIRERAEKQPGFTERKYNDALLSYGAPPLRYVRERMTAP